MEPIPDHLFQELKIIFIGFNPSVLSGTTGHHYANPTNRFWKILHLSGLTDHQWSPEEDGKLPEIGYGLTNIVPRPTRNAEEITKEEYKQGREILKNQLAFYRPKIACFVGKGVYLEYSGKKKAAWGEQPDSVVPGIIDFVGPSSSGLVRMPLDDIVAIYNQLKKINE